MEPIFLTQLEVFPLSCLYFTLPESESGRNDVSIMIEYIPDAKSGTVHCWAWAQVGDPLIRGLVDDYEVPYQADRKKLDESIIGALNQSKRFEESLPGFISSMLSLDPDA